MEYALRIILGFLVCVCVVWTSAWGDAWITLGSAWVGAWLLTALHLRTSLEDVAFVLVALFCGLGIFRDAWIACMWGVAGTAIWYAMMQLFASQGSRMMVSISSGMLFLLLWSLGPRMHIPFAIVFSVVHVGILYAFLPKIPFRRNAS